MLIKSIFSIVAVVILFVDEEESVLKLSEVIHEFVYI